MANDKMRLIERIYSPVQCQQCGGNNWDRTWECRDCGFVERGENQELTEYQRLKQKAFHRLRESGVIDASGDVDREEFHGELNRILAEGGGNTIPTWPNHVPHSGDCECGYCLPTRLAEAKRKIATLNRKLRNRKPLKIR